MGRSICRRSGFKSLLLTLVKILAVVFIVNTIVTFVVFRKSPFKNKFPEYKKRSTVDVPKPLMDQASMPAIAYSDIGDVVSLMVPVTADVRTRINRAKSLEHEGREDNQISDALVDLFGFTSQCGFEGVSEDEAEIAYGSTRQQRRPAFESLLVIQSRPKHEDLRDTIRSTWGSTDECRKNRVLLRFVMGRPRNENEANILKTEFHKHRDILVGNFTDRTKRTDTLTSLLAVRWALSRCQTVKYFIYADDHTFMWLDKLPGLISRAENNNQLPSILGSKGYADVSVCPCDLHSENPLLDRDFYPSTCDPLAGFLMPFSFASDLYRKFIWTTKAPVLGFHLFLGLAAEEYHWTIRHSNVFSIYFIEERPCIMKSKFTARGQTESAVRSMWDKISDPSFVKLCP